MVLRRSEKKKKKKKKQKLRCTRAMSDSMAKKTMMVAAVVTNYWVISMSMVFLNRYLLSSVPIDAPIFVTWLQCLVAVAMCYVLASMRGAHPFFDQFPPFSFDSTIAWHVMPVSLGFAGMIVFNNLCLKFVGVAFYNVGRSLTTVFNVLLTYLILGERVSLKTIGTCAVIVLGFMLGVDQEQRGTSDNDNGLSSLEASEDDGAAIGVESVPLIGVAFGVLASLCVAINAIMTKKVLPAVDGDKWRLTLYNNMNTALVAVPIMFALGEVDEVIQNAQFLLTWHFWAIALVAGVCGVAIGLASMLQIKHTSPLTHNISGTAKACAQTVIAVTLASQLKGTLWWLSNFMVLGGSLAYAHVKRQEMFAADAQRQLQHAKHEAV
jgi:solute carrier family 35 (GDP-fucose transporter), member C1